jgi:phage tail protein X
MRKDVKTGLFLGLALAAGAAVWLATRPGLSTMARFLRSEGQEQPQKVFTDEPPSFVTPLPHTEPLAQKQEKPESSPTEAVAREYDPAQTIVTRRFHIVRKGDTLSSIAKKFYGTSAAAAVKKIMQANRIDNPNKIAPGTKLIIPD